MSSATVRTSSKSANSGFEQFLKPCIELAEVIFNYVGSFTADDIMPSLLLPLGWNYQSKTFNLAISVIHEIN